MRLTCLRLIKWDDLPEPRPSRFQVRYKPSAWTGRPTPQPLLQVILPGAGLCGGAGPEGLGWVWSWAEGQGSKSLVPWTLHLWMLPSRY